MVPLVLRELDFMEEFTDIALHAENRARYKGNGADHTDFVIISQPYDPVPRILDKNNGDAGSLLRLSGVLLP